MSQRQFASVLFAVLGVFIAVSWLPQTIVAIGLLARSGASGTAPQADVAASAISLLTGALIAVLLGIGLVLTRDRLAARLFAAESGQLSARDTQAVALSVLGCYFAISALPRVVRIAPFGFGGIQWPAVAELVLGIGVFLGARGIARLWAAARSAGSTSSEHAV